MECSKWEEMGLLYSSGELTRQERDEFVGHCESCTFCSEEHERYLREKKQLFTGSIFEETPSPECDAEILRVCSDARVRVSSLSAFQIFVKKATLSVALFVLGFAVVGYITLRIDRSSPQNTAAAHEQMEELIASHPQIETAETLLPGDSVTDTTPKSTVNFARTRGNLDLKGVVPVDLQNK
jgi:hypothetical protein